MEVSYTKTSPSELYHFGIKGQKWGVRRYQNADGSLTEVGKSHYNKSYSRSVTKLKKKKTKVNKLNLKSDKYQLKSDKAFEKSYRTISEKRSDKLKGKGYKFKRKASRYNYKASKVTKSGEKYYKKMESKFSTMPVSTFNKEDVDYVKKYANTVLSKYSS